MRLPFKIVRNPPLPKLERKLELTKFFTFKNGHSIYTYKIEDLVHISGRYLDQIKTTTNFMLQYSAGPDQVKAFCNNLQGLAKAALDGEKDKTEALIELHHNAGQMPKLQDYVEDIELKLWHDLYVMFFCLDTEPELAFTPKQNALKLQYLETCTPEEQELFFFHLKGLMISFSDTYRSDILNSLIKEGEQINLVESLINPMKNLNTLSKSANMQE